MTATTATGKPWALRTYYSEILCHSCAAHTPALPIEPNRARAILSLGRADALHCERCEVEILPPSFDCIRCGEEKPLTDSTEHRHGRMCWRCYDRTAEGRADHDAGGDRDL